MNKIKIKENEEKEQIEKFLKTKVGQEWFDKLSIVDYQKTESPDFILKTKNDEAIAFEITKFISRNKNLKFSQVLTTIGNKICREAESKYNLQVHIIINKYDERKFSIHWKDHVDLAYNPGFSRTPNMDAFKQNLQDLLKNNLEKLKNGKFVQEWIQIEEDFFKISINPFKCPCTGKYDCHVNNAGIVSVNPIDELQNCIDKKNKKIELYKTHCTKCYLLIFVPNAYNANFCTFNETILAHDFHSKFDKIFLYEEDSAKTNVLTQVSF